MKAQPKSPTMHERSRRGTLSNFESLLRIAETKVPESNRDSGGGAAVLYLRVSTQRQMNTATDLDPDGNSIATQREATIKRAKRLKAPIVEEFVEPGHSAQSIANRPVFRELLRYVEDNPDVSYVIIYMRSRVFRNQTDAAITKRILDSMGVKLISAKEEFGEGYMADAMEAITDIMNEVQVRQSGEDISNKMLHKAKNGGTTGRAKLGYLNVRKDMDGHLVNSIALDPKRAPLVTWAFERYATGGYSLTRLQQELAEQGFTTRRTAKWEEKPVSRSQIGLILRDPYYLGMVTYKGEVYPGKHEALVSPEVFERVQRVLDVRMQHNHRDIVHNHVLRGMLCCGRCHAAGRDRRLVYSKVSKLGYTYEYYLCAGRQEGICDLPHLPVDLVEDEVLRAVEALRLSSNETADLREQIVVQLERQLGAEKEAHARIKKELASLDAKEDRLLDLAADGSMTSEKVRERLSKLQVQRVTLTQRLTDTEDYIRQESNMLLNYLDLLEYPGSFYAAADDEVKRKFLSAYFSQIWVDDDGHRIVSDNRPQEMVARIRNAAGRLSANEKGTEHSLGASDSAENASDSHGIFLSKTSLVHRVHARSKNTWLLPPTPVQVARLVRIAQALKPAEIAKAEQKYVVRGLRRRLGARKVKELVSRYEAGEYTTDLSREYGISKAGLLDLLRGEGVSIRKQPMTPEDIDRAVELYESGLTIKQVVEQIGYSNGPIRSALHARGVRIRPGAVKMPERSED